MTLVSCLMPTRGRRAWVPLALRCWMEQTAAFACELLVIDDGPEPCADLLPQREDVRYIYLDGQQSIGAKFNAGCSEARGDLLAAWADDDWHAPGRLALQVAAMTEQTTVQVCGCDGLRFYAPRWGEGGGEVWLYEPTPGRSSNSSVTGGTQLWRRSFWHERPFDTLPASGEDTRFIAGRGPLLGTLSRDMYLATIHTANTSRHERELMTLSENWRLVDTDVSDLAADWWLDAVRQIV